MSKSKVVVGLVVVVCAFAVSASSAAAAGYFATSKHGPLTKFEAKQKNTHVFTTNGHNVECMNAAFKGTTPPKTGSKKIRVFPSYENCKFGGEPAKVTNEGCEFEFTEPTGTTPHFTGNANIITNKASECHLVLLATISSFTCEITVQSGTANSNLSKVGAEDMTGNLGLSIASALVGITYTATGTGCGLDGISSGIEGKYAGEVETEAMYIK